MSGGDGIPLTFDLLCDWTYPFFDVEILLAIESVCRLPNIHVYWEHLWYQRYNGAIPNRSVQVCTDRYINRRVPLGQGLSTQSRNGGKSHSPNGDVAMEQKGATSEQQQNIREKTKRYTKDPFVFRNTVRIVRYLSRKFAKAEFRHADTVPHVYHLVLTALRERFEFERINDRRIRQDRTVEPWREFVLNENGDIGDTGHGSRNGNGVLNTVGDGTTILGHIPTIIPGEVQSMMIDADHGFAVNLPRAEDTYFPSWYQHPSEFNDIFERENAKKILERSQEVQLDRLLLYDVANRSSQHRLRQNVLDLVYRVILNKDATERAISSHVATLNTNSRGEDIYTTLFSGPYIVLVEQTEDHVPAIAAALRECAKNNYVKLAEILCDTFCIGVLSPENQITCPLSYLDDSDGVGFTQLSAFPLLIAAKEGDTELCRVFLDYKADINQCDQNGRSALLMAAAHGKSETVSFLLENPSIDIEHSTHFGYNVLFYACLSLNESMILQILQKAKLRRGNQDQLVNQVENSRGRTPLIELVSHLMPGRASGTDLVASRLAKKMKENENANNENPYGKDLNEANWFGDEYIYDSETQMKREGFDAERDEQIIAVM